MGTWARGIARVLVGLCMAYGGLAGLPADADEPAVSVVDWLKARGEDASIGARRVLFGRHFGAEAYVGSAEQNVRLLAALTAPGGSSVGSSAPGGERTSLMKAAQLRTIRQDGLEITYDLSSLVLRLDLPEEARWVQERTSPFDPAPPDRVEEPPVLPTLPVADTGFVCAAVLSQKAKQFDDGLYAAVEEALQDGPDGKRELLRRLRERLTEAGARDAGTQVVEAAARLGAASGPTPAGIETAVRARLADFEADPKRSKPLGFYPWTRQLSQVFRQDRMLQSELSALEAHAVVEALRADPVARATYVRSLRCYERLTNAYAYPDLRPLLDAATEAPPGGRVHVLPPSQAHETELVKRLYGGRPIPDGWSLMDTLVREVQAGRISLAPTATSGWYDRQTWAYEPLLRPETTPEAPHLALGTRYRAYLVELFKGLLALTRETHVKQLEMAVAGACAMPQVSVHVPLPFTVEPLPTHYARRADAYAFVRSVLEETFGGPSLATLHRRTIDGPVAVDLATELTFMEALFRGAAEVSRSELGVPEGGTGSDVEAGREAFRRFARALPTDPDLTTDARMMVPVFHDLGRDQTKVWVFLGWTRQTLSAEIAVPPRRVATKQLTELPHWDGHVVFHVQGGVIYSPVVAEVYVTELLDREQMRRRCDEGKSRSAILASLR